MSLRDWNQSDWEQIAAFYVPLAIALIARLLNGRQPRQFAACLLSLCWTAPSLLIVDRMNALAGWWTFTGAVSSHSMPMELFIGWAVLWGLVPQVAFPHLRLAWCAALMVCADLIGMPMCGAFVHLGPHWLAGEAAAVVFVLLPALSVARWTRQNTHLEARATIQVATAGLLFLYLLPEITFDRRRGQGWGSLLHMVGWHRQLALELVALLAVPGVSAVMDFAERGGGTPIPYDPPRRLVTSGMYRYCRNPMQTSCALVMLAWAAILHSYWMLAAAVVSIAYSAGVAAWDEGEDLDRRFGVEWREYRSAVRNWLPRWRPYHAGAPATAYMARTCGPCSAVRAWLEARAPVGLNFIDAEDLPSGSIMRMRYDPGDGSGAVEGVRAMARALEHLHLGWALGGAILRLPGVWQSVQLLMDASGLGPRRLQSCPVESRAAR